MSLADVYDMLVLIVAEDNDSTLNLAQISIRIRVFGNEKKSGEGLSEWN